MCEFVWSEEKFEDEERRNWTEENWNRFLLSAVQISFRLSQLSMVSNTTATDRLINWTTEFSTEQRLQSVINSMHSITNKISILVSPAWLPPVVPFEPFLADHLQPSSLFSHPLHFFLWFRFWIVSSRLLQPAAYETMCVFVPLRWWLPIANCLSN